MANRDVYYVDDDHYQKMDVSFKWYPGFAKVQKQRSIRSLHEGFLAKFPRAKIIEISSASENEVGVNASAFNLKMKTKHGIFGVEQLFQSAKVFSKSGAQVNSLQLSPKDAKKQSYKLNKNEELVGFNLFGLKFPLKPMTLFYDWLYLNALIQNKQLAEKLIQYNAFTDINVKPNYTINSQAQSCAIFVFLMRKYSFQELQQLLRIEHLNQFIEVVYGKQAPKPDNNEQAPKPKHKSADDQHHFEQTDLF